MATYEELIAQRAELDHQIETARRAEQAAAIETVRHLIGQFQLTAADCGFKPGKNPDKLKPSVAVRFRGPHGEAWSGRGRAPRWLVALEGQGVSREKFRI